MANDRIFYACQAVVIVPRTGEDPLANGVPVRGLQSVGLSSTFNLEQIFEIGQVELYENTEEVADIEVTLEKVIDGRALIFQLTSAGKCQAAGEGLVAAAKNQCDVYLYVFDDTVASTSGQTVKSVCWNSGMYTSNVSYSYSVDGNATESVTLVGNDRFWNTIGPQGEGGGNTAADQNEANLPFDGADVPLSGVQRRVNFDPAASDLPAAVKLNAGDKGPLGGEGSLNYHIQSVNVSADFGQENLLELGRFGPYAKFTTFPIEISSDFEVIASSGDLVSVSGSNKNQAGATGDLITLKDDAGTVIALGNKNKLTSVSYSGADTGGGNATVTYSYVTYNELSVDGGNAANEETNGDPIVPSG